MSSIIEGYNYDIFISYRQKDNKHDGWVTDFVNNLKGELEATFKEEISVYFDINPHDGLLETHDVYASLKEKLKCLIFIPIISRTYCDPESFAWEHEFKAFVENASQEQFGLKVKLPNGNVASRVLPVRIHDLYPDDIKLVESVLGIIRSIDFIYHYQGVNRPLRQKDDDLIQYSKQPVYRDQVNKVANAIEEIIHGLKSLSKSSEEEKTQHKAATVQEKKTGKIKAQKEEKEQESTIKNHQYGLRRRKKIIVRTLKIAAASIFLILCSYALWSLRIKQKQRYARYELIPQIQKMIEENFTAPSRAFELALEAEKYIPGDSVLNQLWPKISGISTLKTDPPGAKLSWKGYDRPYDGWKVIGTTPLKDFRIPLGFKRIKIEKEGFDSILLTSLGLLGPGPERFVKLDSTGVLPENMIRVPSRNIQMILLGFESQPEKMVGEFLIDRYEVTNKEYKEFIDGGGYDDLRYWTFPIYNNGVEISREAAMKSFVDKTGIRGPAQWEVGNYAYGQDNYPVTGISWYEASAYAAFRGKILPTVYHWSLVAENWRSMDIVPLSNFNGKSTVPVDSLPGISSYGIYGLAGNAREWCYNLSGNTGESYILGGGWNDAEYSFNDAGTQPSIDRSAGNGFRCIKLLPDDTTFTSLSGNIAREFRDYSKEKPVDDRTFNLFLRQFDYDKLPLNASTIEIEDHGNWKVEKVTIDAAYNNERFDIWLFLPKDIQPPYQPVLLYHASNVIYYDAFNVNYLRSLEFIVQSGRALVFPVLKGTCERRDGLNTDYQQPTVFYKDHVLMWRKDFGRTIDYLETRSDILSNRIGFFGWSWGGFMGGVIPAVESRIKAVVLHVGGMEMTRALPEVDQINFLPRVRQPVLMLNGKYDMFFPLENTQMPMFNFLGTPAEDKRIIIYDTGHLVPRNELIKETLAWYDKYLGSVK